MLSPHVLTPLSKRQLECADKCGIIKCKSWPYSCVQKGAKMMGGENLFTQISASVNSCLESKPCSLSGLTE